MSTMSSKGIAASKWTIVWHLSRMPVEAYSGDRVAGRETVAGVGRVDHGMHRHGEFVGCPAFPYSMGGPRF